MSRASCDQASNTSIGRLRFPMLDLISDHCCVLSESPSDLRSVDPHDNPPEGVALL
jgi:hypothetical protein